MLVSLLSLLVFVFFINDSMLFKTKKKEYIDLSIKLSLINSLVE